MASFDYIIIGGGMAADAAVKGIRKLDRTGSIGLFSTEIDPPYDRPPLTKDLWVRKKTVKDIDRKTIKKNVDLYLSQSIERLDLYEKSVIDSKGQKHHFNKLLLATGGRPRRLNNDIPEVIYYRTLEDYRKVRALCKEAKTFGIIGGGFIGSELAASLNLNKRKVTMVFPENGICGLVFPPSISEYLTEYYRKKGINVITGQMVKEIQKSNDQMKILTDQGGEILVDCVIAGIGIVPNDYLARDAGLEVKNGIVVDEHCLTSHPDIYAAGDVANFENHDLGKRLRFEHKDNANTMGNIAGRNMAGANEYYTHLPFFYSDLFEFGYEAVGEINAKYETYIDWVEENQEGVIYYLEKDRIRGIILWNIWEQVDNARELIRSKRFVKKEELNGLLRNDQPEIAQE